MTVPFSPIGLATVFRAARSLPASGSVAPYANRIPSSAMRPIQRAFWSSVPPTVIGSLPRNVASTEVATPRSMRAMHSQTR